MTLLGFLKSLATTEEPCTTRVVEVRGAKMELKRCERPVKVTYRLYRDHGGYPEGEMDLLKPSKEQTVVVDYVSVNTKSQKKGVGTFLYEEAAKEACRLGYTLTSSNYRSEFSEAFWRKQARKGRAGCVAGKGGVFKVPMEEAQRAALSPAQFEETVALLPKPQASEYADLYWTCDHYQIDDPCETTSLAGLKRMRRRK